MGEKLPLYQEPDCLLITASVSHSRGDQVSLPFFYILEATHCTIKDGPSPPPFFSLPSFSQKIQQSFMERKMKLFRKRQITSML